MMDELLQREARLREWQKSRIAEVSRNIDKRHAEAIQHVLRVTTPTTNTIQHNHNVECNESMMMENSGSANVSNRDVNDIAEHSVKQRPDESVSTDLNDDDDEDEDDDDDDDDDNGDDEDDDDDDDNGDDEDDDDDDKRLVLFESIIDVAERQIHSYQKVLETRQALIDRVERVEQREQLLVNELVALHQRLNEVYHVADEYAQQHHPKIFNDTMNRVNKHIQQQQSFINEFTKTQIHIQSKISDMREMKKMVNVERDAIQCLQDELTDIVWCGATRAETSPCTNTFIIQQFSSYYTHTFLKNSNSFINNVISLMNENSSLRGVVHQCHRIIADLVQQKSLGDVTAHECVCVHSAYHHQRMHCTHIVGAVIECHAEEQAMHKNVLDLKHQKFFNTSKQLEKLKIQKIKADTRLKASIDLLQADKYHFAFLLQIISREKNFFHQQSLSLQQMLMHQREQMNCFHARHDCVRNTLENKLHEIHELQHILKKTLKTQHDTDAVCNALVTVVRRCVTCLQRVQDVTQRLTVARKKCSRRSDNVSLFTEALFTLRKQAKSFFIALHAINALETSHNQEIGLLHQKAAQHQFSSDQEIYSLQKKLCFIQSCQNEVNLRQFSSNAYKEILVKTMTQSAVLSRYNHENDVRKLLHRIDEDKINFSRQTQRMKVLLQQNQFSVTTQEVTLRNLQRNRINHIQKSERLQRELNIASNEVARLQTKQAKETAEKSQLEAALLKSQQCTKHARDSLIQAQANVKHHQIKNERQISVNESLQNDVNKYHKKLGELLLERQQLIVDKEERKTILEQEMMDMKKAHHQQLNAALNAKQEADIERNEAIRKISCQKSDIKTLTNQRDDDEKKLKVLSLECESLREIFRAHFVHENSNDENNERVCVLALQLQTAKQKHLQDITCKQRETTQTLEECKRLRKNNQKLQDELKQERRRFKSLLAVRSFTETHLSS